MQGADLACATSDANRESRSHPAPPRRVGARARGGASSSNPSPSPSPNLNPNPEPRPNPNQERKLLGQATAPLTSHWPAEEAALALALAASAAESEGDGQGSKGEGEGEGSMGEEHERRIMAGTKLLEPS